MTLFLLVDNEATSSLRVSAEYATFGHGAAPVLTIKRALMSSARITIDQYT